ncbi:MAG: hypothetical protein KZQ93_12630 [Candidatus Thiodiazotropha sp. (ex Monitilora ramsayi)]|nr:hypothetical protein [Candidatus Thiodiazotropha sp. (ex Monitilora ramsayi)]
MDILMLILVGIGFYGVIYFIGKLVEERKVKQLRQLLPELTKDMSDERVLKFKDSIEKPR